MLLLTDAQAEIFRGRGGLLEWGHFDRRFMLDTRKKGLAGKTFGVFSPRYS